MRFSQILSAVTATGAGSLVDLTGRANTKSFQATIAGTGTTSATVLLQASLDGMNWFTLNTFTLSNTTPVVGFTSVDAWPFFRGNVTAISGTGATVNLTAAL